MKLSIVRDPESLEAMAPQWRDLCGRTSDHYLFQTFDWLWAWWTCQGSGKPNRLHVIHGEEDGRTVLIWPLLINSGTPWRMLRWMGEDGDYADVLVEDGGDAVARLKQAWRAIVEGSGYDVVVLDHLAPDARVRPLLEQEVGAQSETFPSPIIACGDWPDWDAYYKTLSKNLRSNQRRRRRKLGEHGEIVFETVDGLEDVQALLVRLQDMKIAWLEHRGEPIQRFQAKEYWEFVDAVVRQTHAAGTLYAARLRAGDTVVAVEAGILYRGRLYSWLSAFDMAWAKHSPGRILLEESLKWSFENGVKTFDFLAGPDAYKFDWAKQEMTLWTYVRPRTIWGRLYCLGVYGPLRGWIKGVFHAMPKGLRNLLVSRFLVR